MVGVQSLFIQWTLVFYISRAYAIGANEEADIMLKVKKPRSRLGRMKGSKGFLGKRSKLSRSSVMESFDNLDDFTSGDISIYHTETMVYSSDSSIETTRDFLSKSSAGKSTKYSKSVIGVDMSSSKSAKNKKSNEKTPKLSLSKKQKSNFSDKQMKLSGKHFHLYFVLVGYNSSRRSTNSTYSTLI